MKTIKVHTCFDCIVEYIPHGTRGYVKTIDNEIRECECLGAIWINDYTPQYTWRVAGYKEPICGSASRLPIGIIYQYESDAQIGQSRHNAPSQKGEMTTSCRVNILKLLQNKYGFIGSNSFDYHGTFNDYISINAYKICEDNSIRTIAVEFNVVVNEDGLDIVIPALENNEVYSTEESAVQSTKKLKVIHLGDDEEEEQQDSDTKIRLEVEIMSKDLDKIQALCANVKQI